MRKLKSGITILSLLLSMFQTQAQSSITLGATIASPVRRDSYFDHIAYENKVYLNQDFTMPNYLLGFNMGLSAHLDSDFPVTFDFVYMRKVSKTKNEGTVGDRYGTYSAKLKRIIGSFTMGVSVFKNPRIGIGYDMGAFRVRWKKHGEGWSKMFSFPDILNGFSLYAVYDLKPIQFRPYFQFFGVSDLLLDDGTKAYQFMSTNFGINISFMLKHDD